MPVVQTTYTFAPSVSIEFNEATQQYTGSVLLDSGVHEFQGATINDVTYQVEQALLEEYQHFERSIGQEKTKEKEKSRSRSGGSSDAGESRQRERIVEQERATTIQDLRSTGEMAQRAWKGLEYYGMLKAMLTGNFLEVVTVMLVAFGFKRVKFAAIVAGQRVTASSPHKLRKAMMVKRNQLLQAIVQNVRIHAKNKYLAIQASQRIRQKKAQAIRLGHESWEKRVGGRDGDWRNRVDGLRRQVNNTRAKSKDLWMGH